MAGSFGYQFIFFSVVFYAFIGFILVSGGNAYLVTTIPNYQNFTAGSTNFTLMGFDTGILNPFASFMLILGNPFSAYGFLAWLSIAIFITDVYIIITSLIP